MSQTQIISKEAQYWDEQFKKCQSLRQTYENQWYLNLAFYMSKQYVVWSPPGGSITIQRLVEPPAPKHRVRIVANKIKPIIRTELTKLTREEPQFYVVPNTSEPSDITASKVAKDVIEYILDHAKFNKARRKATFWMLICGSAFIKDTVEGDDAEIAIDAVTPFHIFVPNLYEEDLQKQPYIMQVRTMTADELSAQYEGIDIKPEQTIDDSSLENKFFTALGIKNGGNVKDVCFVKEIWVKPCKKYPKGAFLVFSGSQLIYSYKGASIPPVNGEGSEEYTLPSGDFTDSEFPFSHGKYPYSKIDHVPAGRFYGTSVIDDLIPLQKEYNRTRSQIIESKNRTANPQMVYVKGSIDPNKVTSEPGLQIPVSPGMERPRYMTLEPLPNYVLQELDRTLRDMDDLSGQYEVSKGRTPPGIEAASAIAYLQEENDGKLYHTVASIEEAVVDTGYRILNNVQEFWDEEKLIRVVSKNSSIEAFQFKGSDLKDNTDLRIESDSMAPKSRAARQAFITDLMKQGLIPAEKGLRYLHLNETNRLYEELQIDSKAAQRENYKMTHIIEPIDEMGKLIVYPVNIWDNTEVHLNEHGNYIKSEEFELLPQERQKVIVNHYMLHLDALGAMNNVGLMGNPESESSEPGISDAIRANGSQ